MAKTRRPPSKQARVRSALRHVWLKSPERSAALKATGYRCAMCQVKQSKAKGREVKIEVHHIDGIDWDSVNVRDAEQLLPDPSRLMPLCVPCHKKVERAKNEEGEPT